MPYFNDLHTYLHQSSLLIQAYPSTRITTKYSLPRKPNPKAKSNPTTTKSDPPAAAASTESGGGAVEASTPNNPKREPSATLTLKTFHPPSGICLKYRTDKAAEVGRLLNGLGRLAKGELVEMPVVPASGTAGAADKMDVDGDVDGAATSDTVKVAGEGGDKVVTAAQPQQQQQQQSSGGGGGKNKKKKGKK